MVGALKSLDLGKLLINSLINPLSSDGAPPAGPDPRDPLPPPRNGSEPQSRLTDLNRWPSLYLCPRAPDTSYCKASASPFINH
jgi:hypothetical protein